MQLLLVGWIFGIFLYLKIAMEAAFRPGIPVLAALILAIVAGLLIVGLTAAYVVRLAPVDPVAIGDRKPLAAAIKATWLPFVLGSFGYVVLSMLIVFGFAEDLSRQLGGLAPFGNLRTQSRFINFALLCWLPLITHYVLILMSSRVGAPRGLR